MKESRCCSPLLPTSIPTSSAGPPAARNAYRRVNSRGRGKLPVWVVRILDVLRCMGSSRHMIWQTQRKLRPQDDQQHEHSQVERDSAENDVAQLAVPDALDQE